ncbi:sodium/calcium exchanger 1-like isoform X1 [Heterodontus francisci]|uniref:sodium/calcium exchanger 1-like isoform X1 n=1 Tax=Heterodontus francisci TaxID=7792 RepID=UPI00355C9026
MVYMFLGMSIIADRFMASIEVITSQEREITIKKANGETMTATVRIWNETVSNLTLMSLGSSAPEILLSVIEVCGHNFEAGVLGPATIVGSAAFNMFIIIAICIYVVPDGENRKIKHLRVFFVTASWSIFAYIWLYLILAVISPGVVEVWEGLLTFLFFPTCVILAWIADRRLLIYKYMYKRYRADKNRGLIIETVGERPLDKLDVEMDGVYKGSQDGLDSESGEKDQDEEARRVMARVLRELRQRHPEKDTEQLIELANYHALTQQQKSRAFYRIQATRLMTGAGNILKKHAAEQARKALSLQDLGLEVSKLGGKVSFEHAQYQCFENCGTLKLAVTREGGDSTRTVQVDYRTEDGTANAGSDYEFAEGTLVFKPGEMRRELSVGIIDDDIFEEDEYFYVRLCNLRVSHSEDGHDARPPGFSLGERNTATVTIFDDDHAGIFSFEHESQRVSESVGVMRARVQRTSGARGTVHVPFKMLEGAAKASEDFEQYSGHLVFENDETLQMIEIQIIDDEEYEKNKNFFVELGEPVLVAIGKKRGDSNDNRPVTVEDEEETVAKLGCPCLGEVVKMEIVIEESYEFKSTVDKLIKKTNLALVVSSSSWREQFVNAVTVSADTFASKVAAIQDQYADASIGNVTGSNAVNVFLGIGVAWSMAAIYWASKGKKFYVNPGNLAFSVTLFTIFAFISIAILMYRRRPEVGGELGGSRTAKVFTSIFFVTLWLLYVILSALEAYCHIKGF